MPVLAPAPQPGQRILDERSAVAYEVRGSVEELAQHVRVKSQHLVADGQPVGSVILTSCGPFLTVDERLGTVRNHVPSLRRCTRADQSPRRP